jgi:3-isopropylmalate/(R)-2-methylmalate dehydratase small subunit
VSPRFGDIFRTNATKSGLVPVVVPPEVGTQLLRAVEADPDLELVVDVERRTVSAPAADIECEFPLDDFTRHRLLEGLDDVGLTLRKVDHIDAHEARRPDWHPTTA